VHNGAHGYGFGVAAGEGLDCYLRGFDRGEYVFSALRDPGDGRVALKRYTQTIANGYIREILAYGDTSPGAGWGNPETIAYTFPTADADPRLRTLYECVKPGQDTEAFPLSVPGCGDSGYTGKPLGGIFYLELP
jgi:hypothetical protein